MSETIRYGTRGSALALAQSGTVAQALRERSGRPVERTVITTSGDRFAIQSPGGAAPQPPDPAGSTPNLKAMFVKEIEEALLSGSIDFAVHSAKDLPAEIPKGLVLAAFPPREDPRDAFLPGARVESFAALGPSPKIATGSLRRQIQLRLKRPDASFAAIRGNVDTRLRRLDSGEFDGMVLAVAGLKRLGLASRRHEALHADLVIPAPGQGSLAIEAREDRADVLELLALLDDRKTRLEVDAERAFLAMVGGGCATPLGCLARIEGDTVLLRAFWSEPDGSRPRRKTAQGPAAEGPQLARRLAQELLGS
ncbi:MAG: hydroxymethylbilane synthase [Elusimicrobia bacterium]|nr:hydroxymethylbilane synthase [Elusimicrobiota bacterium]